MNKNFDVIVVGAGHAGVEAAAAVGRSGGNALLISLSVDNLGFLSCNPAVGGVGKGQIVREVDALGGIIGRAADYSGIHFKRLNLSRGAAVRSRRVQVDRDIFKEYVKNQLLSYQGVGFLEGEVSRLIIKNESISGVRLKTGVNIMAPSVVLAPGTFLSGRMFAGLNQKTGGRTGEPSSDNLSRELENIGLNMLKFKTSTCARIRGDSIDFSKLIEQMGDEPPAFFSILSKETNNKQVSCHITHTNSETHRIINDNLDRSPHHTGMIKGAGVRYCPSIEDKLFKFPDAERHQVFLEPESANREIYYPNGIFTSLPEDVQKKFIRSIEGLENAKIFTYGYGIEYNLVNPLDLKHCLETKKISGLFLAGQINGTTGYEEAAGQGLIAGVNALAFARDSEKLILKRDESYIGVMIDDLVTLGTLEPYRMFTSRAEHRLKLRESNVYERLEGIGRKYKVIGEELSRALDEYLKKMEHYRKLIQDEKIETAQGKIPLIDLLKKGKEFKDFKEASDKIQKIPQEYWEELESSVKYQGYIKRQEKELNRLRKMEAVKIKADIDYSLIPGLSREAIEKFCQRRPATLYEASRIPGIPPSALMNLSIYMRKTENTKK